MKYYIKDEIREVEFVGNITMASTGKLVKTYQYTNEKGIKCGIGLSPEDALKYIVDKAN